MFYINLMESLESFDLAFVGIQGNPKALIMIEKLLTSQTLL